MDEELYLSSEDGEEDPLLQSTDETLSANEEIAEDEQFTPSQELSEDALSPTNETNAEEEISHTDEEEKTSRPQDDKDAKSVSADLIRGHINTIILRSLADGDKYGYEIIAEIENKSHGQYSLKQPSLYSALKRLESQGYVTSYWGGSVGGGRRKYFSLTEEGEKITEQNRSEWEYSRTIIDSLISDKDFDFSNPAPTIVNMRVLKSGTSRVPSRDGGDEDELDFEPSFPVSAQSTAELEQLQAIIKELEQKLKEAEERLALLAEELHSKTVKSDEERALFEDERRRFEEERARLEEDLRQMRMREETLRADKQAQEESFALRERTYEERLAERDRILGEERTNTETYLMQQSVESEAAHLEELKRREDAYRKERDQYELLLTEKDAQLEEERERHKRELDECEAAIYKKLHDEMQHQSYLNLVNTPPPAPAPDPAEYSYYTAPIAEETPVQREKEEMVNEETEYRTVVRRMYENTVQNEPAPHREERKAQPLDGVNFRDIEERAAQDGIRVTTAGKKQAETAERSQSVVHKGKALFLSALVVFFLCIVEGGIVLALRETYSLSAFWPYFIWAIGLAVLLITGLAYANHFGERALRRNSPALINAAVLYALAVIFVLIIALGVNIDFTSPSALASFIVIPIIWLFGIVVFGVTYWVQVKPLKD